MEADRLTAELSAARKEIAELRERIDAIERRRSLVRDLPDTGLLSPSFLARAFAVFGHHVVAALLVFLPIYALIILTERFLMP
jgi:hypothetical protein